MLSRTLLGGGGGEGWSSSGFGAWRFFCRRVAYLRICPLQRISMDLSAPGVSSDHGSKSAADVSSSAGVPCGFERRTSGYCIDGQLQ